MKEEIESDTNFYERFQYMIIQKGHKMEQIERNGENKEEKEDDTPTKSDYERISEARTITEEEYEEIIDRQKHNKASEKDKYELKKYIYMTTLGVDEIDTKTIQEYYNKLHIFYNHINLIDIKNVRYYDAYKKGEKDYDMNKAVNSVRIANELLKELGYKHCYDNTVIDLEKTNKEHLRTLINEYNKMNNKDEKYETTKALIGGINGILHQYCVKMENIREQKTIKGQRYFMSKYKIKPIKNITEYILKRIDKGLKIYDTNKIIHYITTKNV